MQSDVKKSALAHPFRREPFNKRFPVGHNGVRDLKDIGRQSDTNESLDQWHARQDSDTKRHRERGKGEALKISASITGILGKTRNET